MPFIKLSYPVMKWLISFLCIITIHNIFPAVVINIIFKCNHRKVVFPPFPYIAIFSRSYFDISTNMIYWKMIWYCCKYDTWFMCKIFLEVDCYYIIYYCFRITYQSSAPHGLNELIKRPSFLYKVISIMIKLLYRYNVNLCTLVRYEIVLLRLTMGIYYWVSAAFHSCICIYKHKHM